MKQILRSTLLVALLAGASVFGLTWISGPSDAQIIHLAICTSENITVLEGDEIYECIHEMCTREGVLVSNRIYGCVCVEGCDHDFPEPP